MVIREELVNSAVSFLQDPSVASAPLDSRVAFLESKNLTQEEINAALTRAAQVTGNAPQPVQQYGQQPPPGYGSYPGYWQAPPPELPRRDWRDWFIMATVMGGVGFGLYVTAKRYILPLIKPPTPEQLTQDKESIDAAFSKAFAAIEEIESVTKVLKEAEVTRTSRLDSALTELEAVVSALKESDRKREDDARRNADEIRTLRDLIPKSLEAHKVTQESRIRDLAAELKSLRTLMGNRMGSSGAAASGAGPTINSTLHRPTASTGSSSSVNGAAAAPAPTNGTAASTSAEATQTAEPSASAPATKAPTPSASPFPRFGTGKAAIPAWQMAAAAKKPEEEAATEEAAPAN